MIRAGQRVKGTAAEPRLEERDGAGHGRVRGRKNSMGKGPGVGTNEESTTNGKKARVVLQSKEGRQRQRTEDSVATVPTPVSLQRRVEPLRNSSLVYTLKSSLRKSRGGGQRGIDP